MKKAGFLLFLFLAGCSERPLTVDSMRASESVYSQIEPDFYLKHSVAVAPVNVELPPKILNKDYYAQLFAHSRESLALSLDKAHMLARGASKAKYILHATLVDVQDPGCFLGTCETGATVKYALTHNDETVYSELLVVPQNYEYPLFGANMPFVIRQAYGAALGNNFAHVIHVLANKTQKELK
jgi:hypothetical protein